MKNFTSPRIRSMTLWSKRVWIVLSISLALTSVGTVIFSYFTARNLTDFALQGTTKFAQDASDIFKNQAKNVVIERISSQARAKVMHVETLLSKGMAVAVTLSETLATNTENIQGTLHRKHVSEQLRAILKLHPEFTSIFTYWEPNAFDQKDNFFINKPEHDGSGRFMAYWERDASGEVVNKTLLGNARSSIEEKQRYANYYLTPRKTMSPNFIPLTTAPVNSPSPKWISLAVAPIVIKNKFAGIIGVGFTLSSIQTLVTDLKNELFSGGAEVSLLTSTGLVAASSIPDVSAGAHISALDPHWAKDISFISSGKPTLRAEPNRLVLSVPIHLKNAQSTGSVYISIPERTIVQETELLENALTGEMDMLHRSLYTKRNTIFGRQMFVGVALLLTTLLTILLIRKLARQSSALQESEFRLKKILNNTSTIVFVKSSDGKFLYTNPSFSQTVGLSPNEIAGKTDLDLFSYELAKRFQKNDKETLDADCPIEWEEEVNTVNGLQTYITTKFPLHDSDGKTYGLCGIAVDITEKKRSLQQLHAMERVLADIIDSMPSALIGVDSHGKIKHWNTRSEKMFTLSRENTIGTAFVNTLPELADQWPRISDAITNSCLQPADRKTLHANEERIIVDISIFPLQRENGREAVMRIDDMTGHIRIEEIMIQTEKMMSVGGLAAGMAHEINNPLGAVLQGAQNIERRLSPDFSSNTKTALRLGTNLETILQYLEERKILSMLEGIQKSGVRAARIVQNMLNFSRKSESHRSAHTLEEIADHAIELAQSDYNLKKQYDIKQIQFLREHAEEAAAITCIETEIEQVVLNLIRNAAQAMAEKEISSPSIIIRTWQEFSWAILEIEDNGPGMDEGTRKRIFEPFFTTKPPGAGTGLGLSVSYFIITQNHGGIFTVDSEPHKGTRFTIKLPISGHIPDSGV